MGPQRPGALFKKSQVRRKLISILHYQGLGISEKSAQTQSMYVQ